ncbi:CoA transferase [Caballeronia sp. 15711]|uniref:CoA transferase n=1 Tax=Caballeronia sp. 15711 TaxID=3391029 RepID=UPI0039E3CC13
MPYRNVYPPASVAGSRVGPLDGLDVIEVFGLQSCDIGRAAVSFAGMLAARMGAHVKRVQPEGGDPMRNWAPSMADGSSATSRFLLDSKELVDSAAEPEPGSYLLTDDAGVAEQWGNLRKVLVRSSFEPDRRAQSELTIQAVSGLLDIVGEAGRPPLALPGYQMAYATGLTAFSALLALHCSQLFAGKSQSAQVAASEVATWLNWKHGMSSVSGVRETGVNRQEEWEVVPCRDGFVAAIFRDRDMPALARLMRSTRLEAEEFKVLKVRANHLGELRGIIADALADRSRDEIVAEAQSLGLPFAAVLPPREVIDDPQMRYREFFERDGGILYPRLPVLWNGHPLTQAVREYSRRAL